MESRHSWCQRSVGKVRRIGVRKQHQKGPKRMVMSGHGGFTTVVSEWITIDHRICFVQLLEWIYSQELYFEPRDGGEVRIFGFYNKKKNKTNKNKPNVQSEPCGGFHLLTDKFHGTIIPGVFVFFYPTTKTSSIMPPDAGDPVVKSKNSSAQHHRRTRPTQDWWFLSFTPPPRLTCIKMLANNWSSPKAREYTTTNWLMLLLLLRTK